MIQAGVIGDEVEHQQEPARPEALAQTGQRRVSTEARMHRVAGDRKPGARDVLLAQVRQCFLELPSPFGVGARHPLAGRPRSPHTQEPDPVEPQPGHAVQLGVGDVIERGRPPRPRDKSVSQTRVLI
jgi:hypothetical protein